MLYKDNWNETREKFSKWWRQKNTGRPLMRIIARDEQLEAFSDHVPVEGGNADVFCQGKYYNLPEELKWRDMEDKYMNPERIVERYRWFCEHHFFLAEAFPNLDVAFGPGSLAAYLGSEIGFREDTVWFEPCIDDWEGYPDFRFDPEQKWYKKHLEVVKECRELVKDDFYIDMPDLMENIDVISSLRGGTDAACDLIEDPDEIKRRIGQITDLYYKYFDSFYDIIKDGEGGNAYNCFQIWGPGRTTKLQCDFSAMMGPASFDEFIRDSLKKQAAGADYVLYHLDGQQAIKHLPSVLQADGIKALQWTSGDTGPDGTLPDWYVIYDQARKAGKSLWVKIYSGSVEDWMDHIDALVKRYGSRALYLFFPEISLEEAKRLIDYAENNWSDVEGTFDCNI